MEFTKSLIKGKLIKRYKRFFTDIKLGKEIVTAHCPNTGSMKGLLDKGNEVHKEAFKILESYYQPGEFNEGRQKMAWMPENANLILNPTSGAPGFSVENVFSLPGVPSILKSMLGGLKNTIVGGEPIKSLTISLRTFESEIANSLTKVQNDNQDVEIGSYPFFHAGKLGVSIVIRSEDQNKIDICNSQTLKFINKMKIEVVDR